MDSFPAVSIIIPCHNSESTIERTLDALVEQSFSDFEVIIVDDRCCDATMHLAANYKDTLKLFFTETGEVTGAAAARNVGLDFAAGKFVLFLDADDVYHIRFIEVMQGIITSGNTDGDYDAAVCSYTRDLKKIKRYEPRQKPVITMLDNKKVLERFLYNRVPCGLWSFMFCRSLICEHNITFDQNLKYGEDREFVYKYLAHVRSCAAISDPLYGYLPNDSSAVSRVNEHKLQLLESVNSTKQYLQSVNHPFAQVIEKVCYPRTVWAVARTFAKAREQQLYIDFLHRHDVRHNMRKLITFPDVRVAFSAFLFLISPRLFYMICRFF